MKLKKSKNRPGKKRVHVFKRRMLQALDLPLEAEGSVPKLSMVGRNDLLLENHMGVLKYTKTQIRLVTQEGMLLIEGENLELIEMAAGRAYVRGEIAGARYE